MNNTENNRVKISLEIDRNIHEILKNKITESFSKFFEDALWYAKYQFLEKNNHTQWKNSDFIQQMRRACDKVYFNRIKVDVFIFKELVPLIEELKKWMNPTINLPSYIGILFIIDEYCLHRPANFSAEYYFFERLS